MTTVTKHLTLASGAIVVNAPVNNSISIGADDIKFEINSSGGMDSMFFVNRNSNWYTYADIDATSVSEAAYKSFDKYLAESAYAQESISISFGRFLFDTSAITEMLSKATDKITLDTVTSTESGSVANQTFALDYFSDDYVGKNITF